jgi:hypothetical protein
MYQKCFREYAMVRYKKVLAHLQEVICLSIFKCGQPDSVCLW